jgi:hypothetical protein
MLKCNAPVHGAEPFSGDSKALNRSRNFSRYLKPEGHLSHPLELPARQYATFYKTQYTFWRKK